MGKRQKLKVSTSSLPHKLRFLENSLIRRSLVTAVCVILLFLLLYLTAYSLYQYNFITVQLERLFPASSLQKTPALNSSELGSVFGEGFALLVLALIAAIVYLFWNSPSPASKKQMVTICVLLPLASSVSFINYAAVDVLIPLWFQLVLDIIDVLLGTTVLFAIYPQQPRSPGGRALLAFLAFSLIFLTILVPGLYGSVYVAVLLHLIDEKSSHIAGINGIIALVSCIVSVLTFLVKLPHNTRQRT